LKKKLPLLQNVTIEAVAAEGKCLFHIATQSEQHPSLVVFVPFCVPGDVVDVQITRKKHVSAVEVKSENDYTTSSLDKFRRKFGQSISASYVVHPGDIRQKDGILYMPIYMTPWLTGVSPA
jgi:tRNA/tmRNA/rRNA uracil-C5-methylase (TrmA/RlmC/RlmD family)